MLLVSFSGCIDVETKVKVNKDGSGTVEETVLMGQAMVEMMNGFAGAFGDQKNKKPFKLFDVKELKKAAVNYGEGVSYLSGEKLKRNGQEGYKVIYKFKDINTLKIDQSPDSKGPMKALASDEAEKKEPQITYFTFKKGDLAELTIFPTPKDNDKEAKKDTLSTEMPKDSVDSEANKQALEFIKGMRFAMSVQVNGVVVESDASCREGSLITLFDMDFGKFIDNVDKLKELEGLKNADNETVKKVLQKFPGMKVELNDKVVVKFK